jgi:hypothetical protein
VCVTTAKRPEKYSNCDRGESQVVGMLIAGCTLYTLEWLLDLSVSGPTHSIILPPEANEELES